MSNQPVCLPHCSGSNSLPPSTPLSARRHPTAQPASHPPLQSLGVLTAHLTQLRGGEWRGVIGAAAGRLRVLKRELQGRGPPIRALLQLQLFLDSLITAQWGERCKEKVEQVGTGAQVVRRCPLVQAGESYQACAVV